MQRPATTDHHHPDDPRSRVREALDAGDAATAQVWATLAAAESNHRLCKTLGRIFDVPDSNRDAAPTRIGPLQEMGQAAHDKAIERGRTRRPHEQPSESEQAA